MEAKCIEDLLAVANPKEVRHLFFRNEKTGSGTISSMIHDKRHKTHNVALTHAISLEEIIKTEKFNHAIKFTVVRNPWERLYSWYQWLVYTHNTEKNFHDFLASGEYDWERRSQLTKTHAFGYLLINKAFRFETYDVALKKICKQVGRPLNTELHRNNNPLSVKGAYQEHYTKEILEICKPWLELEAEAYGYTFD